MSSIVEEAITYQNLAINEIQAIKPIVFILHQFPSKKVLLCNVIKKRRRYKIVDEELLNAVISKNCELINSLYKLGYNIYANNDFLLRLAVENNSYTISEFLLKNGADPTANYNECFHKAKENNNFCLLDLLLTYHIYQKSIKEGLVSPESLYLNQYNELLSKLNNKTTGVNKLNF